MKFLFTEIMKILKCTERGQVTLPKKWRDKMGTCYFQVFVLDDGITLKPVKEKSFKETVEDGWQRYLDGADGFITHEEMEKKYGL
ncbi:MAG: AbrB/MazE/SpoVT family DNA-binding domain-containing protein [Candidatus Gracilibacteria bacterium]|jgi:AbrB family looped-hinge helix DNA binding protein